MAGNVRCSLCHVTTVRIAGEQCAACRKGRTDASQVMTTEPRAIVETQLRQLEHTQSLTQEILDHPRTLLCAACHESPLAVEQVDVVLALESMVKQSKVLSGVIPVWQKLVDAGKEAADQMSLEEMQEWLLVWFKKRQGSFQRELLQALTQAYNEHPQRGMEKLGR